MEEKILNFVIIIMVALLIYAFTLRQKERKLKKALLGELLYTPLEEIEMELFDRITDFVSKETSREFLGIKLQIWVEIFTDRICKEVFSKGLPPQEVFFILGRFNFFENKTCLFSNQAKITLMLKLTQNNNLDKYSEKLSSEQKNFANNFLVGTLLGGVINSSNYVRYSF